MSCTLIFQASMSPARGALRAAARLAAALLAGQAASLQAQDLSLSPALEVSQEANEAIRRFPITVSFDEAEDRENILVLDLSSGERVLIRLVPQWAPNHVLRIKELTRAGFYDGVLFHRVIDGFMAQTGDPTGTGMGGSELPDLEKEFNVMPHVRGSVSMARANEENSANSQFFIVFYPRFALDRRYTNFGRVIAGMDAVDRIERGEPPSNPTRILQASIAADNRPRPVPELAEPEPERITLDMLNNSVSQ